jgi:hypothetical protein
MMVLLGIAIGACGDDDGGNEADRAGVGAQCTRDTDCRQDTGCDAGGCAVQVCLTEFRGGYCGVRDCDGNDDCPDGAVCVAEDGANYCFRSCRDKPECNLHRTVELESNCSSSVDFVEEGTPGKVCVPPSGT